MIDDRAVVARDEESYYKRVFRVLELFCVPIVVVAM
jgi:ATP-dependent helicase/DNAse subunit B